MGSGFGGRSSRSSPLEQRAGVSPGASMDDRNLILGALAEGGYRLRGVEIQPVAP